MKTVYKSKKVPVGVELTLSELLECIDGLAFDYGTEGGVYTFDMLNDGIVAKVKGNEVKLNSVKVILTNPENDE